MKKSPRWDPGTVQEGELPLVTATSLGSAENHTEHHWEPPGILISSRYPRILQVSSLLPLGHHGGDTVWSSVTSAFPGSPKEVT